MRKIFFVLFLIGFLYATYSIVSSNYWIMKEKEVFQELIEIKEETGIPTFEETKNEILEEYQKLVEINSDMIGWIQIEGTHINYPVMNAKEEVDYYLTHNFYKKDSSIGTPFVSKNYQEENNHILIHGHNVNRAILFSELLNYQKKSFFEEHPVIRLDSLKEKNTYQIIAVFKSKVFYEDEVGFKYYKMDYNLKEEEFAYYIEKVKSLSLYETGITARYGDSLLTLSTCDNKTKDGRFVVVAKKNSS